MNKEQGNTYRDPAEIIAGLSKEERKALLRQLLASPEDENTSCSSAPDLLKAEQWFWNRLNRASSGSQRHARLRMAFIFMFLRYGGLKITEIFNLTSEDLNFAGGLINVHSERGTRATPLPMPVARRMLRAWETWGAHFHIPKPFCCDSSQIRRGLRQCALAVNIDPDYLNARSLRRWRGRELEMAGLSPELVKTFLGHVIEHPWFNPQKAMDLLRISIQKESKMKTSARNVFVGKIVSLRQQGIMVEVIIETSEGLKVASVITETSLNTLKLQEGMRVNAIVKAPWVTVLPGAGAAYAAMGAENRYPGKIGEIRKDDMAEEILVELPQGNLVCALYAFGARPSDNIVKGADVMVCFSAFAVILTLD